MSLRFIFFAEPPPLRRDTPPAVPWKAVAIPAEHGGWGFLAEPVVLGLVLAPSAAGACLALAALAAFLARHPLRLLLLDRRKGARYPRTALAGRVAAGYALGALLLLAGALALAPAPFWPPLVLAAPLGMVALAFDARGRSREALPEAAGAVALAAGPRAVQVGHAVAVVAATALAAAGWAPWLAAVVFLVLLVRSGGGLSSWRRPLRPQALGLQEVGYGLLTVVLLAIGYRLGP